MHGEKKLDQISQEVNDLSTFDLEDLEVPTVDALQQIDAENLLTMDDLSLTADEFLLQDIESLFY